MFSAFSIFQYLTKEIPPIVLRQFPVSFYSADLLTIVDEVSFPNPCHHIHRERVERATHVPYILTSFLLLTTHGQCR